MTSPIAPNPYTQSNASKASAKEVRDFHTNSDLDASALAHHHTLGKSSNQAAPGDHSHSSTTIGNNFNQSFIGKNAVGASVEAFQPNRHLMKQVAVGSDSLLNSIDVYCKDSGAAQVASIACHLYTDSAGSPSKLMGLGGGTTHSDTVIIDVNPRWLSIGLGIFVPAGTYWIEVCTQDNGSLQIYYDSGGSDKYYDPGNIWVADPTNYTISDSAKSYSIRGSIIN